MVLVGVCLVLGSMAAGLATSELQTWLKSQPWYLALETVLERSGRFLSMLVLVGKFQFQFYTLLWWCFVPAVVLSGVVLILQRRLGGSSGRAPATRTEADFQRNRRQLLERVQTGWIEGVLEQSLYKVARIELGLETKPDAVESPLDVAVQRPDQELRSLPRGAPIRSAFDELGGQLLILGDPGTGKTTLLLELARDLLDRAKNDEYYPVPVVFNLSSWAKERPPLLEWLADDLNRQIPDIPEKTWRVWLEQQQILPLLDGLDEVALEHRQACVARINEFRRQKPSLPLVVCSRTRDYGSLDTKLQMPGAAEVQPLKPGRVSQFLEQAGEPVAGVRAALQGDTTLWEVLDTPLMLNIAVLAYQGVPESGVQLSGTLQERRATLFSTYIDAAFKRLVKEVPYTRDQAIHWVGWLAAKLVWQGQTIFYLEDLQPNWLGLRSSRVVGLVHGLFGALVYGLFFLLLSFGLDAPVYGLVVGLVYGLVDGLFGGKVIARRGVGGLKPADTMRFSWAEVRRNLFYGLFVGLVYGLFVGLVFVVVFVLVGGLVDGLFFGLFAGLFGGLVYGLVYGLGLILDEALVTGEIATRSCPNEGTRQSLLRGARSVAVFGVLFGLVFGLSFEAVNAETGGDIRLGVGLLLSFGLFVGLGVGLDKGGGFAIQHWVLRFLLWRKRFAPLRYVRFLDHAAERVFLRKVGGGYIFIHRMLMEHFASMYESETRATSKAQSAAG